MLSSGDDDVLVNVICNELIEKMNIYGEDEIDSFRKHAYCSSPWDEV